MTNPNSNAAHKPIEHTDEEEDAPLSPATRALHDFASSAAMQVLRDWAASPEIKAIRAEMTPDPAPDKN